MRCDGTAHGSNSDNCPRRGACFSVRRGRSSNTVRPPMDGAISRSCAIAALTSASGLRLVSMARVNASSRLKPSSFSEWPSLACVERASQHADRLVVDLERHRERMAVLPAVREREPRRIVEPRRRAVHHFGDERQRLQRARTELLDAGAARRSRGGPARARGPAPRRAGVALHVGWPDVVVRRHLEPADGGQRAVRIVLHDRQQRVLRRAGARRPPGSESRLRARRRWPRAGRR